MVTTNSKERIHILGFTTEEGAPNVPNFTSYVHKACAQLSGWVGREAWVVMTALPMRKAGVGKHCNVFMTENFLM
jgi:hypothetical protein